MTNYLREIFSLAFEGGVIPDGFMVVADHGGGAKVCCVVTLPPPQEQPLNQAISAEKRAQILQQVKAGIQELLYPLPFQNIGS